MIYCLGIRFAPVGTAGEVLGFARRGVEALAANESVEAVQKIVNSVPAPNGLKAYVTGPAALTADQHMAGDRSLQVITTVTFVVIIAMLLLVYRSIITVLVIPRHSLRFAPR